MRVPTPFASSSRSPTQRARLALRFPGVALHADTGQAAIGGADIVVLAVKPQQMRDAARGSRRTSRACRWC